jgi:hypothetical protein
MARNRAWRRAQALRLIQRRRNLAYQLGWDPTWFERVANRWDKINPWTQCSCWMCQYQNRPEDVDWRKDLD